MTKKKGHGKNNTSYPHRKKRRYGRMPNNARKGSPRFYNKPPKNGDYRSRIISQLRHDYYSSADLSQMGNRSDEHFPPYGQGGEKLENRGSKGYHQRRREKYRRQMERSAPESYPLFS